MNSAADYDVVVVGAGPAGNAAALELAGRRRVALIDAASPPRPRIGESLPAAARPWLQDAGLLEAFLRQGHAPWYANRFVWGDDAPAERDGLLDPHGHGWHLDRARFETWLRDETVRRGATLLAPARVANVEREDRQWRLTLEDGRVIRGGFLLDAGGRAAPLARKLGAKPRAEDKLVCRWQSGRAETTGPGAGVTFVEAVADGWWYCAPLPGGRRVLAFHTDADLPEARPGDLLSLAKNARVLPALLAETRFTPLEPARACAAHSGGLDPATGDGWLATGDAALCFDPISSQGLLSALFTGRRAGRVADARLAGSGAAFVEYTAALAEIRAVYQHNLAVTYASELRFPASPFWRRRRALAPATTSVR